jgi:hypothetical protein
MIREPATISMRTETIISFAIGQVKFASAIQVTCTQVYDYLDAEPRSLIHVGHQS